MVSTLNKPTVAEFEGTRKPTVSEFERVEPTLPISDPRLKERALDLPPAGTPDIVDPQTLGLGEKGPAQQKFRPRWDEFIDATARGIARVGSAASQAGAFMEELPPMTGAGMRPAEPLTPRQVVSRKQASMKLRKNADFLWKLSQNPELAARNKDLASKALNLIGETIPYITATTAGYVTAGPMGGFTVGSLVEGNSAYRNALDYGVPESKAKKIGIAVGVVSGAVEAFGGKYAEQLLLKATAKLKTKIAKAGAVFGIGTVVEALEEGAQEIAAITGEETYRDVNWNERVSRTLGAMAGGGFLGGAMRGGSMAGRGLLVGKPPTEPIVSPRRPVAPITKPKAPTITEYEAKPEAVEVAPEAKAEPKIEVIKRFHKFSPELRASVAASQRMGHRAKEKIGEYFYSTKIIPDKEFETAKEARNAAKAVLKAQPVAKAEPKVDLPYGKTMVKEAEPTKVPEKLKAEPVKPKGKPGLVDVKPLLKAHQTFMRVLEPARAVERIAGKEAYATVIKGIHQTDVGRIEFTEAQLVGHDKTIGRLGEWFNKFSDKDLRNLMLSRGQPTTVNAELIQQNAINNLPKALRGIKVRNAIEQIANFNYRYLQKVAGDDINKVADYFYGIYKDPDKVDRFLDYWRTTKRFTKEKKLPTVADAVDYGLELRNYNPIENLKAEYLAIAHLEGMTWMRDELLRTGKGKYIDETLASPMDWRKVKDPVFRDLRLQPDLAHLINNLIATNQLTKIPTLNMLRQTNNFLRTVKFIGSAFHLLSVAKQSVADSGYLGFLYKPTALRGITRGFRKSDPIFRTTAYKDYIRHGGGHRYSVESEARRAFSNAVNELNRNMGIAVKVGALPLRIPTGFVNWMFQSYIPKVKYAKFLDVVAEQEKKLGRVLTSPEKINIIKEQQNFYGMMNERLFGRSGTVTTAMRFYFMSPGYAEGNYRTMLKAAIQWGGKTGFKANRSRSNIINSWLITGIAATVGTLAFTGKPPKKPEDLDDARDLFKIDTGKKDEKDRKIMIDLMTYDKDYWNVAFNILRLRPDVAVDKSWKRIGGMKAPTAEIIVDLAQMSMGKAIYDWKGDRVVEITDPFLRKAMKLTVHEVKKLTPISVSVFQQSRKRDIDTTVAAIGALLGYRPTKTEKDLEEQKLMSKMISLRGQREELSWYIGKSTDPKGLVKRYNKTVNDILNSPYVPKSMKDEWGPKLIVDYEKVVTWKRFPAGKMTNAELRRAYDAHTLSVPYKRRGEPFRQIGAPKKGSERRVEELKAEAKKRGIELKRSPRKPPRR